MVSPQSFTVADVGCDHAYVSIAIIRRHLAEHGIAMDVRNGPLAIAADNIREQGLSEKIDVRLGDGLARLAPGEADTVIIAGMGGLLMKKILEEGRKILESAAIPPCLILQPQSDLEEIRIFIQRHAYHIVQEKMLVDEGKYYTVIKACPGKEEMPYDEVENRYGRENIKNRDAVLFAYLLKEKEMYDKIEKELNDAGGKGNGTARRRERLLQIGRQQKLNALARKNYEETWNEMQ